MKFIFGLILAFISIIYWLALLKNIPHMWGVMHSKAWSTVHPKNTLLEKLYVVTFFILCGIFGIFLFKWVAQLLGIIN